MKLIDADALELILSNAIEMMRTMAKALDSEDDPEIQMEIKAYTDILTGVKEQPTIEERKTGHWVGIDDEPSDVFECDVCGHIIECIECGDLPNFCENCGSDMREVKHEVN